MAREKEGKSEKGRTWGREGKVRAREMTCVPSSSQGETKGKEGKGKGKDEEVEEEGKVEVC